MAAEDPEQLAQAVQKMAVRVDPRRAFKYLEVAQHVAEDECKHHGTRHRHDNFLAIRRLPKSDGPNLMRENPCGAH
jgi:hypothetical protein